MDGQIFARFDRLKFDENIASVSIKFPLVVKRRMDSFRKEIIRFSYNELCPTNEIGGSGCRNGSCRLRHALVIAIIFQQQSDSEQ